MKIRQIIIIATLAALPLAVAAAQEVEDLLGEEMPLPGEGDALLGDPTGEGASAPDPTHDEDVAEILNQMTPEEIEELVKAAATARLEVERKTVLSSIERNILYEEQAIEKAREILLSDPANTQTDNIDRICKAYATTDDRFARVWRLYEAEDDEKLIEVLGKQLNPEDISYLSAARHYVYANTLRREAKPWKALDAYQEILVNLPDRISFASASAQASAEMYEDMGRRLYAMEMYYYCLKNYSLTLTQEQVETMYGRYKELEDIYADPLAAACEMMDASGELLAEAEIGEPTQQKQEETIALLEDLIKTTEEKQRLKEQQQQQQRQQQRRQQASKPGEKKPGQSQQRPGQQPGQNPTSPMQDSALVPGPVSQPNRLAKKMGGEESERWADMPPRQREKIKNLMQQRVSERRGDLVRDYHRKLAEGQ
jgi:hypothetical protein